MAVLVRATTRPLEHAAELDPAAARPRRRRALPDLSRRRTRRVITGESCAPPSGGVRFACWVSWVTCTHTRCGCGRSAARPKLHGTLGPGASPGHEGPRRPQAKPRTAGAATLNNAGEQP